MRHPANRSSVLLMAAFCTVGACAVATNDVDDTPEDAGASTEPSVGKLDGAADGAGTTAGNTGGTTAGTTGGSTTSGTTPPPDAGSGDAGVDAPPDAPPGLSCAAPNACPATLTDIGSLAGDKSGQPVARTGPTSEWLKVLVLEEDSNILFRVPLRVRLALRSPLGGNYGMYVYSGGINRDPNCAQILAENGSADTVKTIDLTWEDRGGSSDNRLLTVEVRNLAGDCRPDKQWSLEVQGNVP